MNIEKVLNNPENREQLLIILKNRIESSKNRSDSSVSVYKAEALLDSIIYILSLNEEETGIMKMYEEGLKQNSRLLKEAEDIYERLLGNLFINDNRYYNSTLKEGIKAFFSLYDKYLYPENYLITADYPLMIKRPDLKGASFIKNYLYCIETENIFLKRFEKVIVHKILLSNNENYEDIPLNLCESLFINWLFGFKSAAYITDIYQNKSPEELNIKLNTKINNSDISLREKIYFSHYLESNIYKLYEMIRARTLETVIYHEKEEKITVSFDDCKRLSDFQYAEYLGQLRYEQNYEVLKETDSIFDIGELLMEAIDDPNEMLKAVNMISEEKFMGLLIYFRDYESLFREALYLRLENMERNKQNKIKKMLDNVKDGQDY